ncbi:MAG: hypothetical protein JWM57_3967 [Phycisphaerales bacterium]|nr:hypothetical protein [Phycisphaerales bacterium]
MYDQTTDSYYAERWKDFRTVLLLFLAVIVAMVVSAPYFQEPAAPAASQDKKFDAAQWAKGGPIERFQMTDSLSSGLLIGKTPSEVRILLGKPATELSQDKPLPGQTIADPSPEFFYDVSNGKKFRDESLESYSFVIRFQGGRVTKAYVDYD